MARRSKSKTKVLSIATVGILILALAIGGMLAYFTDTDTATNEFTIGDNVDIELTEVWTAEDGLGLHPGAVVEKAPSIENESTTTPAYVFATVTVPCYASTALTSSTVDTPLFTYTVNSGWTQINVPEINTTTKTVTYVYAYGTASSMTTLAAEATTATAIFDEVTLAPTLTSEQAETVNAEPNIVINAYGIQIDNLGVEKPREIFKLFNSGINVDPLTGDDIVAATNYGQKVNYSVTVNGETLDDWEIFLKDGDTVYMIYGDYLPNAALPSGIGIEAPSGATYRVQKDSTITDRAGFISSLTTTSNWSSYITSSLATAATTAGGIASATGGPTAGQFKQSYNDVYPNTCTISGNDSDGWNWQNLGSTAGYSVEESNNLYWPHKSVLEDPNSSNYCYGYWLASPYADNTSHVVRVTCNGGVANYNYDRAYYGLRPLISLPSSILEQNVDGATWDIVE